mmetsp:Transcript_18653/g.43936  ORF Transcript_18653/g.43936 Transcript_18653/m.43936 type:complete len:250 (+) Transcript_18653:71-820(+)
MLTAACWATRHRRPLTRWSSGAPFLTARGVRDVVARSKPLPLHLLYVHLLRRLCPAPPPPGSKERRGRGYGAHVDAPYVLASTAQHMPEVKPKLEQLMTSLRTHFAGGPDVRIYLLGRQVDTDVIPALQKPFRSATVRSSGSGKFQSTLGMRLARPLLGPDGKPARLDTRGLFPFPLAAPASTRGARCKTAHASTWCRWICIRVPCTPTPVRFCVANWPYLRSRRRCAGHSVRRKPCFILRRWARRSHA